MHAAKDQSKPKVKAWITYGYHMYPLPELDSIPQAGDAELTPFHGHTPPQLTIEQLSLAGMCWHVSLLSTCRQFMLPSLADTHIGGPNKDEQCTLSTVEPITNIKEQVQDMAMDNLAPDPLTEVVDMFLDSLPSDTWESLVRVRPLPNIVQLCQVSSDKHTLYLLTYSNTDNIHIHEQEDSSPASKSEPTGIHSVDNVVMCWKSDY